MVEVIDKPSKPVDQLAPLKEPRSRPHGRWEIDMMFHGAGRRFRGRAVIDFDGAERVISQRVAMVVSHEGAISGGRMEVDVEGLVTGGDITVDVYILDAPFRHNGFKAVGRRTLDGEAYEGRYSMECVNPETCGCGGMEGPFALRRLSP